MSRVFQYHTYVADMPLVLSLCRGLLGEHQLSKSEEKRGLKSIDNVEEMMVAGWHGWESRGSQGGMGGRVTWVGVVRWKGE